MAAPDGEHPVSWAVGTQGYQTPAPGGLHVKQGATLQLLISATNDDGSVFDFSGVTITAQVRAFGSGTLLATLTVVTTGVPGQLSVTQATDTWPPAPYVCDFKFAQGSIVLKSQTFGLTVDPAVTP